MAGVFVLLLLVANAAFLSGFSPRISADKCWAWEPKQIARVVRQQECCFLARSRSADRR
ncbi:hypothetical protein KCP77_19065 [Salmonella enterica subsp. enterica]|nr:hypothetical protein KCP77_19065 [Salmonella enterica subsp. enterica]